MTTIGLGDVRMVKVEVDDLEARGVLVGQEPHVVAEDGGIDHAVIDVANLGPDGCALGHGVDRRDKEGLLVLHAVADVAEGVGRSGSERNGGARRWESSARAD